MKILALALVLALVAVVVSCDNAADEAALDAARVDALDAAEADYENALYVAEFDYEHAREAALDAAGIEWLAVKANADRIDALFEANDFPGGEALLLEAAEANADYTAAEADYKAALAAAEESFAAAKILIGEAEDTGD